MAASPTRRPARAVPTGFVVAALGGTVLLILASFILSFDALTDLARRAGVAADLAFLWPLIVDGLIVVSTMAIIALVGHPKRVVWFPWVLLFAGAITSVAGNSTHAVLVAREMNDAFPVTVSALVASVPPLVLLAVTHLLVVLMDNSMSPPAKGSKSKSGTTSPKRVKRAATRPSPSATTSGDTTDTSPGPVLSDMVVPAAADVDVDATTDSPGAEDPADETEGATADSETDPALTAAVGEDTTVVPDRDPKAEHGRELISA